MSTMDGSSITLSSWLGQHNILTTLLGIVGLLVYIFLNLLEKSVVGYKSLRLPPGPQGWPVVGNLLQLGKLPHQTLTHMSKRYGSLMFLQLGSVPTLVVSSAEMAQEVSCSKDHLFPTSRPRTPTGAPGDILQLKNRGLILAPLSDQWRFMRRVAGRDFFPVKRLEQFQWLTCKSAVVYEAAVHYTESPLKPVFGGWQEVRREEILSVVKRALKEGHDGNVVQLSKKVQELAYNHTTRTLFRKSYFGPSSMKAENYNESRAFQNVVTRLESGGVLGFLREFLPFMRNFDSDLWNWRTWYFSRVYESYLSAIVKEHHQSPRKNGIQDVVDVFLSLQTEIHRPQRTDENLKALIKDLMAGGTETFTNQVIWTLAELMRHPEIKAKVQRELDFVVGKDRVVEESDVARLKYLQSVVKEAFRLHPVLPLCAPLESTMATKIRGYELPSKTRVVFNLYAIMRDPNVWEDPSLFNPERFRRRSRTVKGEDLELLPFGAGPRICLGLNLGLSFVQYTLAQLLHTCDLALPFGTNCDSVDMDEGPGPHLPKARPLQVLVTPRLPPRVYRGL